MNKIPLSKGYFTIVDDDVFEELKDFKWCVTGAGYAVRFDKTLGKMVLMHRVIMNYPVKPLEVDHINGNRLDNRKENLRVCSHHENTFNNHRTSKGVSCIRYKRLGKYKTKKRDVFYVANIAINGKTIYLGSFPNEEMAKMTYDKAAKSLFKDFASTNFKRATKLPLGNSPKNFFHKVIK